MKIPINWKTSLFGILAGLFMVGPEISHCIKGENCDPIKIVTGISMGALGAASKDKDVTGGSRSNTPKE